MAVDIKQTVRLSQQLLMTPQLQQAIKLLQLSRMELEEFVEQQLAENPVLEELPREEGSREVLESSIIDKHMEQAHIVDKVEEKPEPDWEAFSRYRETLSPSTAKGSRSEEGPNYENMVSSSKTLQEYLLSQIGEIDFSELENKIACLIIGNIDERGYLRLPLEEILDQEPQADMDLVEGVLDTIQRLEPSGVGARDLKECLLIQIRNSKLKNGIVEKIVENHLHELETKNYQAIARALRIDISQVVANVQTISSLEPVPGRQFGSDSVQYVIPDIYVFKLGDEWVLALNEDGLPRLGVNKNYKQVFKDKKKSLNTEDREYLQEKLRSASSLIKSLDQRQKTIYRVTEMILNRQKDFFEHGVQALKPMVLRDIAEDLGMHESTISRVTTNKYVHTPFGIFELKYFFSHSVMTASGQGVASESVKNMIASFIKKENPAKPLSDQNIVEMLEEQGVQLARRTVAKYREQLGIAPSSRRKKFF